jgi:hypothetical protein
MHPSSARTYLLVGDCPPALIMSLICVEILEMISSVSRLPSPLAPCNIVPSLSIRYASSWSSCAAIDPPPPPPPPP